MGVLVALGLPWIVWWGAGQVALTTWEIYWRAVWPEGGRWG